MPDFPRQVPDSLIGIADPIISILGPLVPAADAEQVRSALSQLDVLSVRALGLEVVLPPHPPACDLSVLLPPRTVPPFAQAGDSVLASLARSAPATHTTWWELDTSAQPRSVGAFIRSTGTDGRALMHQVCAKDPALSRAERILADLIEPYWEGEGRLIGFFPRREPAPIAAALLPTSHEMGADIVDALSSQVTATVDRGSELVMHLTGHLDGCGVAVAADAEGRTAVSWEGSFAEREKAMAQDRWAPALQPLPVWGEAMHSLPSLLGVQGFHTFDSLPTIRLLSGIDHIKVGPGGKVKAYVGAHILLPGQR